MLNKSGDHYEAREAHMFDDDSIFDHALEAGLLYAGYRHGQDQQTAAVIDAINGRDGEQRVDVHVHLDETDDDFHTAAPDPLDLSTLDMPNDWTEMIGQEPLKQHLAVKIAACGITGERFPHTLFASGYPGVGKTTAARLVARSLRRQIIELVPPFNIQTLVDAALKLEDHDFLFIDEIHKLADHTKAGAEILLKVLEESVAPLPDGRIVRLPNITIIGATTDRDKLPEPVLDRFKIKPYFQAYSDEELARIAIQFAFRRQAATCVDPMMAAHIAMACRGTPRIIEEMVEAARDLSLVAQSGKHTTTPRNATPQEVLSYLEVEPDGLTRTHIHYLTAMLQYFARETKEGEVEYIVGETAMMNILRETKQGIGRIERFLVERGLIDRTPRGRRLTDAGIRRASEFVAEGKGASDVA